MTATEGALTVFAFFAALDAIESEFPGGTNRGRNRIDAERSRCIDAANPMLARTGTNGIDASNALFDGVVQEADYSTIFSNSAIKLMLSKKKEGSDSFP